MIVYLVVYDKFMAEAIEEAKKAWVLGEVPVGAVVEKDGVIIGRGHNLTETEKDPTAHAEIIAIRGAAAKLGGWRLLGCSIYVTCEPCAMCAGAMVLARIEKLITGAPREGAVNHKFETKAGVMEQECSKMMKDFFIERRKKSEDVNI